MATLSEGNSVSYGTHRPNIVHLGRTQPVKVEGEILAVQDEEKQTTTDEPQQPDDSVIDIVINNVVCSFSVRCHLNLRQIALNSVNVEYKREHGMLTMKIRKPYTTASIWSSGKITCTGATSEETSKQAARRFARVLQNLGFRVHFCNFRVVNVLGTCSMPFKILIQKFSQEYKGKASYEPELHPGVTFKIQELKATLKIFSTGSITITAPSVAKVQEAVEHIYPIVFQFSKKKDPPKIDLQKEKKKLKAECIFDQSDDYDSFDSDC